VLLWETFEHLLQEHGRLLVVGLEDLADEHLCTHTHKKDTETIKARWVQSWREGHDTGEVEGRSDHVVVGVRFVCDWHMMACVCVYGVDRSVVVVDSGRQEGFGERLVASAKVVLKRDRMRTGGGLDLGTGRARGDSSSGGDSGGSGRRADRGFQRFEFERERVDEVRQGGELSCELLRRRRL
jgi:hypothetical protein